MRTDSLEPRVGRPSYLRSERASVRALAVSFAIGAATVAWVTPSGAPGSRATPLTSPAPRSQFAMALDQNKDVVLFGGFGGDVHTLFDDTWTWDGTAWTQQQPATHPSARYDFGMAYDAARRQTVLFGGADASAYFNDTWTWDGTNWTEQHPAHRPQGAAGFGMVYDASRREVFVFMGEPEGFGTTPWAWNGRDWKKHSAATKPHWREFVGGAYDGARRQTIMYGGIYCPEFCVIYEDTWTWAAGWMQLSPATNPGFRSDLAMAYDAARHRVVLFGGFNGNICCNNDTWTWDGHNWQPQSPANSPSPREFMGMAWDSARRQVLLFGGKYYPGGQTQLLGDTWTWDGYNWTQH
jgi:hypothetical protein